jgi:hypothetical protein
LLFEAPNGSARQVCASSFTQFLRGIKSLHLVFLNGCSTKEQVDALLASGVRAVVATTRAVHDKLATELAERFYKAVAAGAAIGDAFQQATGAVRSEFGNDFAENENSLEGGSRSGRDVVPGRDAADCPWVLHGEPAALAHRLLPPPAPERFRCRVVITATLKQFDVAAVSRATAELQLLTGDLSLRITKIE